MLAEFGALSGVSSRSENTDGQCGSSKSLVRRDATWRGPNRARGGESVALLPSASAHPPAVIRPAINDAPTPVATQPAIKLGQVTRPPR